MFGAVVLNGVAPSFLGYTRTHAPGISIVVGVCVRCLWYPSLIRVLACAGVCSVNRACGVRVGFCCRLPLARSCSLWHRPCSASSLTKRSVDLAGTVCECRLCVLEGEGGGDDTDLRVVALGVWCVHAVVGYAVDYLVMCGRLHAHSGHALLCPRLSAAPGRMSTPADAGPGSWGRSRSEHLCGRPVPRSGGRGMAPRLRCSELNIVGIMMGGFSFPPLFGWFVQITRQAGPLGNQTGHRERRARPPAFAPPDTQTHTHPTVSPIMQADRIPQSRHDA